jgi:hypothetical protein
VLPEGLGSAKHSIRVQHESKIRSRDLLFAVSSAISFPEEFCDSNSNARSHSARPRDRTLGEADTADEVCEARVAANGIEVGMRFDERQNIRFFLIGAFEPLESLFVVAEAEIGVHESASGNVTCFGAIWSSARSRRASSRRPACA